MNTLKYRIDPENPDLNILEIVARDLKKGELVVFPTETVYGLGANAFNEAAVKKIYEVKGRPHDNPLIVHISSINQLEDITVGTGCLSPEEFKKILEKLWPGPVTFILERKAHVPPQVSAGLSTVAVRFPAHPVARKLIELAGVPVAAPSANLSGRPSPTEEEHVLEDMDGKVRYILLSGSTPLGLESTVLDLTSSPPRILRPGPISVEKLHEILGTDVEIPESARGRKSEKTPLSPGMKHRHYAPTKPLLLVEGELTEEIMKRLPQKSVIICSKETASNLHEYPTLIWGNKNDLFAAARKLFSLFRDAEKMDAEIIVAEGVEEKGLGLAVMNRLRRAASRVIYNRGDS